ncbi:hypothetical protein M422DRAFT_265019 [Sphaerobolus stellatus SS14]|uniref:Uncharacterized protein n=1 Tax=Sphaerobolus stellatus (strain SS14) TaxID=990650 RepID=A0A0C9TS93_SPHS4|nr:hypothetical protein M422DRAFT_265019 [Sphaerobolus stellatus SS14]
MWAYVHLRDASRPVALAAPTKSPASTATNRPHPEPEPSPSNPPAPRPKHARPKTSKACRKQGDGCHRCEVTGFPYLFQPELPATDAAKERKPRPLLPRAQAQKLAANGGARLNSDRDIISCIVVVVVVVAAIAAAGVVLDSQDALVAPDFIHRRRCAAAASG